MHVYFVSHWMLFMLSLFLHVDFFGRRGVLVSCMLSLFHNECCFILETWNVVWFPACWVSYGCFWVVLVICCLWMFACFFLFPACFLSSSFLWSVSSIFTSSLFLFHACLLCFVSNVVYVVFIICLLISSPAEELWFHACLVCFTANVVSFWKPQMLFHFGNLECCLISCMFGWLWLFLGGIGHLLLMDVCLLLLFPACLVAYGCFWVVLVICG